MEKMNHICKQEIALQAMTAEEYIRRYTRRCSNALSFRTADGETAYAPWLTPDGAREAVMMRGTRCYSPSATT